MNKKIIIPLVILSVVVVIGIIFLLSDASESLFCNSFELTHVLPTNYCKNIDGNLQYKDCLDRPENKDNIVGVSELLPCKPFNKESYFLEDKKVSRTEFFNRVNEVNQSCNGCVMIVKPGID